MGRIDDCSGELIKEMLPKWGRVTCDGGRLRRGDGEAESESTIPASAAPRFIT
jgi:hypothetical protein